MAAQSELEVRVKGRDELSPSLAQLESKVIRFVGAVSSALTAIQVIGFPVNAVRTFEKEMANVQKTTGFTDSQIKALGDSLVDLSREINVSAADLASISAAAGQQGLGREGVAGVRQFTESVSRMAAVLDLTVEQAGTDIGKIASIFKIPLRDIEEAVSAFNETSNNSTASGEQLLDVVKRIGDAAGSLNLEQSIGLSATGIDLGLSPEVVGSSFQKVFAEMYGRAEGFSKLLGVSVDDWMKTVQANGIDALKMYLDGLRKLTPEAQQQTIKTLSGGGRIGALVTKLLRDTEDTILDRNVESATRGITTGTSAIKEQLTVLQTLDAEALKLGNSVEAIGIKAGEQFAGPLASYLAQLNAALADETVIQFGEAIGDAFLDLFNVIAGGIKFLADLNVNWTNFVQVAKVFIGLKLVQVLGSMLGSLPGLSMAWQAIAGSAVRAGEAQVAASSAGATGLTKAILLTKELMAAQKAHNAAIAEEAKARAAATTAIAQSQLAATKLQQADRARVIGESEVIGAGRGVTTAKQGVAAAEQAARAREEAVQQQHLARLQKAEQDHAARVVTIENERLRLQSIARANNDRSALLAATRARNEQLAAEEAYYTRSITGVNSYYARRLQAVQAAGVAEVAAARLTLMQSMSEFDGVVNATGLTRLQENARNAAAALATANANVQSTTTSLTLAQRAASAAAGAFTTLGAGLRIAGAAMQGLVAIAGKAFFWLTLVYTVIDALGLTDKLGTYFTKLTDALGLTSEAARQAAEDAKAHRKELEKERQEAEEAVRALEALRDARTGQVSDKAQAIIEVKLKDDDLDLYKEGLDTLVNAAAAAQAKIAQIGELQTALPIDIDRTKEELATAERLLSEYSTRIEQARTGANRPGMLNGIADQRAVDAAIKAYDEQVAKVEKLRKTLDGLGKDTAENLALGLRNAEADGRKLNETLAKTFTPESADVFQKYMTQYAEAQAEVDRLNEAQKAKAIEASQAQGEEEIARLDAESREAIAAYEQQRLKVEAIQQAMGAEIAKLKATGGLSDAVIGSLDNLQAYFGYTKTNLLAIAGILKTTDPSKLTGEYAPPKPKPSEGDGDNEQQTDAELRRLRRARIDLARSELQSIANLEREANSQKQARDDDAFKQNLTSFKEYYATRLATMQDNIDIELRLREQEIGAYEAELAEAKEESEKLRTQAQIVKAQGDIALLKAQRAALSEETDREMRDAVRDFSDRVIAQKAALAEFFGAGDDQVAYSLALESASVQYRDFVQRLRTEAENMPELLPIVDEIELQARFEAVSAAMDAIDRKAAISAGALDLQQQRIQSLREAGIITGVEAAAMETENRKAIIETGKAAISAAEARMTALVAEQGEAVKLTVAYQEMALEIARRKEDLVTLQLTADETGKRINGDLQKSFEQLFLDLSSNEGIKESFLNFFLNVVNSMQQFAAEGLAESLMRAIGSTGDGGFGGFFADLAGKGADVVDMAGKTAATPLYVRDVDALLGGEKGLLTGALDTASGAIEPGLSPATPLYTKSVDDLFGLGGGEGAEGGVGVLGQVLGASKGKEGAEGAVEAVADKGFMGDQFDGLVGTIRETSGSVVSGLMENATSIVGSVGSGLSSVISTISTAITSIIAAIYTTSAAEQTTAATSSFGSAGMGAAHNGGIAGRFTMRRTGVHPSVFQDAIRYHTGGKAGLAPDEVPAILQKGEEVLTEQDPRHRDNLGKGEGGEGGDTGGNIFRVQPVLSESTILEAMRGRQGEKLLLVHIGKNPTAFRQALKL